MILRYLKVLLLFTFSGHNLNNRYADDKMLIAETQKKLQELLKNLGKESDKKRLNINCKKREWMVVNKRNRPRCKLQIRNVKSE